MTHMTAWIRITALLCVTTLEVTAMLKGVNGATFGIAIAAVGVIAGTTAKPIAQIIKGAVKHQ